MNTVMRAAIAVVISLLPLGIVCAAVAETTLCELTAVADFIVIARTERVLDVEGVSVARASVRESLKGNLSGEFYFLAEGTWTCDVTGAEEGETALLFLNPYKYVSRRDAPPASQDEPTIGVFNEPPQFKTKVSQATGSSRLLQVAWAGRGQMPVRVVDGQSYLTIWTDDVQLPTSVETIDGPEPEYAEFIRSAPLQHILFLVRRYLGTCGRAK